MIETVSIPADIARNFTDAWNATDTLSDIAATLDCTEADALADLLRALGAHWAADMWLDAHAESDEPRERHFQGTVPAHISLGADAMHRSPDPVGAQGEG
jgi:hypothetical protein